MLPSALLSYWYISMQEFLRTQEKCIEKAEAQPNASRTSQVLKNYQVLI